MRLKLSVWGLLMALFLGFHSLTEASQLSFAPVTGNISSHFGWRSDPINGSNRFHSGVDIAAPSGSPIYAPQAGTVAYSGQYGGYGTVVVLHHGGSLYTLYGHTSLRYVQNGELVSRGQAIAAVGSTGRSTGPHLHFEVHHNGQYMDPLYYLSTMQPFTPSVQNIARTAPANPRHSQAAGGEELVQPAPARKKVVSHKKRWKHQVEVIQGSKIEVVRF